MLYEQFKSGINIGGWLSQYDCVSAPPQNRMEMDTHLKHFITEENIAQIASWGLDHVRLPIDYRVLTETEESLTDCSTALFYVDRCTDWCEKYHLNLIIDLHHAQGNVYGQMDRPMPLLVQDSLQRKFIDLWKMLAKHFRNRRSPVLMFELLNEVSDGSGYLWNRLYRRAVEAIRQIDKERWILVGSSEQNSPFRLKELDLLDDDRVFYNFHFYDPQVFTHQRAHFSEEMTAFNRKIHYPDDISDFTEFLLNNRTYISKYSHTAMENQVSRQAMHVLLKDALDFVRYSGKQLYCGEFGVIDTADAADAAAWIRDAMEIFDRFHIGHAMWNYKELDFGLIDSKNEIKLSKRCQMLFGGNQSIY
ncbi:MAG: glycoside hydrolase family 5 protein [Lachnospiraceae bacterium]